MEFAFSYFVVVAPSLLRMGPRNHSEAANGSADRVQRSTAVAIRETPQVSTGAATDAHAAQTFEKFIRGNHSSSEGLKDE